VLLEVGPGHTLGGLARQNNDTDAPRPVVSSGRGPQADETDTASLLNAAGALWLLGVEVDWPGFHARERRQRVTLPTYPFERKRHWVEPHDARDGAAKSSADARPDGDGDGRPLPEQTPAALAPVEKANANGNGNSNGLAAARAEGASSDPALDEILANQLRVMSEQLKLLRAD
jgi:acyl transferase domain-containing protein